MNDRIIRVGTDGTVTYHNWPEGDKDMQSKFLNELIGPECSIHEHVTPVHLYDEWGIQNRPVPGMPGKMVSMLIDEEGRLKHLPLNVVASWLYGVREHGCPILGGVVFVGEEWTKDGIEFCPIEEMTFRYLYKRLEAECNRVKTIVKELEGRA